jgi:hypothetical protein
MTASKETPGEMKALDAFVLCIGAKAPVYRTAVVRDRHSGRLAEVPLTELPPTDPGSTGMLYAFRRGERVRADHPAVLAKPSMFYAVADD